MPEPTARIETGNYLVTHYLADPDRVVIAFTSAGRDGAGEPIEEFRNTLARLGVSSIFVIDRHVRWYNYEDTPEVFAAVADLAGRFRHAGTVGESMGGCGAILFTTVCSRVSRVLSFAPQYAIAPPFVRFDKRYDWVGEAIPQHMHWDFTRTPIRDACQIVYGNTEWRDHLHAAMFEGQGFPVTYVDGATHTVAEFLKIGTGRNRLLDLLGRFADFDQLFDSAAVRAAIGSVATDVALREGNRFADEMEWNRRQRYPACLPLPPPLPNLARGKPALQSSVGKWSVRPDPAEDAAGAVSGAADGTPSFHTDHESSPWWQVDLHENCAIEEIRLFNRLDDFGAARRGARFRLLVSADGVAWQSVFEKQDDHAFGGMDGHPFVWMPPAPLRARFVRVELLAKTFLHLDQVEIYGRSAWLQARTAGPVLVNLSRGKPALQSSVSAWSIGRSAAEDASRATAGQLTGKPSFHTDLEDGPWWQVDLKGTADVHEIRLYNRIDNLDAALRCRNFALELSLDGVNWLVVHRKLDDRLFGGIDGRPYIWRSDIPFRAAHMRVRLLGREYLHLDQIEVLGTPADPAHAMVAA